MDKIFKVFLCKEDRTVEYYLSSSYEVEILLDSITPGTIFTIGVLPITDISRENVKDFLI
jgi:hypothetical protein